MSLETEIKQTRPFQSESEKCIVNIIYTNNLITIFHNKIVKDFDISIEQYNVLRILKGQNGTPITINGIIDRMLDKMSNASRLVDKLYFKRLVDRRQKETNRRACDVTLTPKGAEVLNAISKALSDRVENHLDMSRAELEQLNTLLDKFREKLMK
ncbi:MAG: MarR family transcriptional regulator [Leadbetterella sp.]|nr:MarR family transcriptional regulator [Leadbetterella sp.]